MKILVVLVENESADDYASLLRSRTGVLGVGVTPDIGDGEDGGPSGQAMDEMLTQALLDASENPVARCPRKHTNWVGLPCGLPAGHEGPHKANKEA